MTDQLEKISAQCPHNRDESEICLLAPLAAHIGIVAVETQAEPPQWWLVDKIVDDRRVAYPKVLAGWSAREYERPTDCLDYDEASIPVEVVGEGEPAIEVGDEAVALLHLQAKGSPPGLEYFNMLAWHNRTTPEADAIISLSTIVCAGFTSTEPGARASLQIDGHTVTVIDEIDGIVFHGNHERPLFGGVEIPEDKIVLPWARTRTTEIQLSEEDMHKFSNRVQ